MKRLLIALILLVWSVPVFGQNADEPATRDDVILYLRTMHSHDMLRRIMEVQAQSMQQMLRQMILKDKGKVPSDFDSKFKKEMEDLIKGMPADEIVQAMIPAYQRHFTKSDLEAMNAFYSSPVGQKVLQQLPDVIQEGNQAAMPIITKYLGEWQERMTHDLEQTQDSSQGSGKGAPAQN
jgi:uncharacterized protein